MPRFFRKDGKSNKKTKLAENQQINNPVAQLPSPRRTRKVNKRGKESDKVDNLDLPLKIRREIDSNSEINDVSTRSDCNNNATVDKSRGKSRSRTRKQKVAKRGNRNDSSCESMREAESLTDQEEPVGASGVLLSVYADENDFLSDREEEELDYEDDETEMLGESEVQGGEDCESIDSRVISFKKTEAELEQEMRANPAVQNVIKKLVQEKLDAAKAQGSPGRQIK